MIWLLLVPVLALTVLLSWYFSRADEPVGIMRRAIRERHRGEQNPDEPGPEFRFDDERTPPQAT